MSVDGDIILDIRHNVDRLTKGYEVTVEQVFDDQSATVRVKHDSLLKQLREAVSSSMAHSANKVSASERNILDADAMDKLEQVENIARKLYSSVTAAKPFPTAEQNLRQWFIGFSNLHRSGKVSREVLDQKSSRLRSVVAMIDDKLNPPESIEITSPCPRCEKLWVKTDELSWARAITVQSRVAVYSSLDNATATCRGCGATWIHGQGMRQLRWEIDEAETRRHQSQVEIDNDTDTLVGHRFAMPGNGE
jgi:hypothetical protein